MVNYNIANTNVHFRSRLKTIFFLNVHTGKHWTSNIPRLFFFFAFLVTKMLQSTFVNWKLTKIMSATATPILWIWSYAMVTLFNQHCGHNDQLKKNRYIQFSHMPVQLYFKTKERVDPVKYYSKSHEFRITLEILFHFLKLLDGWAEATLQAITQQSFKSSHVILIRLM